MWSFKEMMSQYTGEWPHTMTDEMWFFYFFVDLRFRQELVDKSHAGQSHEYISMYFYVMLWDNGQTHIIYCMRFEHGFPASLAIGTHENTKQAESNVLLPACKTSTAWISFFKTFFSCTATTFEFLTHYFKAKKSFTNWTVLHLLVCI